MAENKTDRQEGFYNNTALSLSQLIGAPLHAMIAAESQAAQATAAFIREFGFESAGGQGQSDDFGRLRMASFHQESTDAQGRPRRVRIDVPLLSLLPVPALQIRDAQVDFFVKIVDVQRSARRGMAAPDSRELSALQPMDFKAALARDPAGQGGRSTEMQMKVRINISQADVPAGMARLFHLMEQGITAREVKSGE
ncbi:DUF2589 domain-containing protein [Geoalkalibacter halelectricus]|uniref:DUF2589 domain-containing protein n=1 Tax=Geoalkalibacter halelectricus TaxID=2847045 RepID=A0ABY5ZM71_9BACT|nr:DUF2589 domain-containing protein [Geoalkalibacter halelectricus]MDO3378523.1 DUF2589 domain-containing protein [Geoalkalibacter halelectricus]UWZ80163.1 DUF2589 domain-containing protein [Geoalkalibacter halelectricus]